MFAFIFHSWSDFSETSHQAVMDVSLLDAVAVLVESKQRQHNKPRITIPVVKAVAEVSDRKPIGELGCCESRMAG